MHKSLNYEKIYFYLTAVLAFCLPIARAGTSIAIILLILTWFVEGDFKRKFEQIKTNKVLLALTVFILYTWISNLWTSDIELGIDKVFKSSYLIAIIVISTSLKKEYIQTIITLFLSGMFISEIIAYGVFFELWEFGKATVQNPSPFMQHIHYSTFMAITSLLLLNRLMSKRYSLKEKIFIGFFFLTVTGNLFLATGRTGQVAFIVGVFTMTILHYRIGLKSIIISFAILITVFTSAYKLSENFVNRLDTTVNEIKYISNLDLNSSWGKRVLFWITTYNFIKENPFGAGIGDYKLATKEQLEKGDYAEKYSLSKNTIAWAKDAHPHNQYLFVLLQTGFIGFFIFLYFLYQILKLKIEDIELKELSILFTVMYMAAFLAEPLLNLHNPLVLFILFVGLFSVIDPKKKEVYINE